MKLYGTSLWLVLLDIFDGLPFARYRLSLILPWHAKSRTARNNVGVAPRSTSHSRSSTKERYRFEKEVLASLAELVRHADWKRRQNALFVQSGDYFQSAFVSVYVNAPETHVALAFKPMAIDPILWDILDMAENAEEPLSFRAWGAFTCSSLPVANAQIEVDGSSPADVARAVLDFCEHNENRFRELVSHTLFSDLVAKHPNQVERGAYAVTLVVSLIHEGKLDAARDLARAYASGEKSSTSDLSSRGESFHQLALKHLDRVR